MKWRTWMAGLCPLVLVGVALAQRVESARTASKPVAVVNGVAIGQAELDAVIKSSGPVAVHLPEAQRRQRQVEALAMLIDNVLMKQFLEKHTQPVSEAEVSRRVTEMQTGLREQGKSLDEFCQDTNQTLEQLKASIAEHLRWTAYLSTNLTEADVEKYHRENRDFFDGTTVRASHIALRISAGAAPEERTRAVQTLQKVRHQLLSDPKADFGELAKTYSQDPQASKGGDLGWIPRKWFDEAFSRAAFALQKGQLSDIVQTEYGVHLILVTDRKAGKASEYHQIKDAVREFCAEDVRQQLLATQRKAAKIEINLP